LDKAEKTYSLNPNLAFPGEKGAIERSSTNFEFSLSIIERVSPLIVNSLELQRASVGGFQYQMGMKFIRPDIQIEMALSLKIKLITRKC
jgi:hypothetical protein